MSFDNFNIEPGNPILKQKWAQGPENLMDLRPKVSKRPIPRAAARPGAPRVLSQGPGLGRSKLYIGVYNTNTHVGGQLIAAATTAGTLELQ